MPLYGIGRSDMTRVRVRVSQEICQRNGAEAVVVRVVCAVEFDHDADNGAAGVKIAFSCSCRCANPSPYTMLLDGGDGKVGRVFGKEA